MISIITVFITLQILNYMIYWSAKIEILNDSNKHVFSILHFVLIFISCKLFCRLPDKKKAIFTYLFLFIWIYILPIFIHPSMEYKKDLTEIGNLIYTVLIALFSVLGFLYGSRTVPNKV
jgi:hypothetical protein